MQIVDSGFYISSPSSGVEDYLDTWFDPLAVGTTTISITQPPGFLPPTGRTSVVATVEPA